MVPVVQLIGGVVVLSLGAQAMVSGGAALALRFGLTPLIIGLTVMAYGTSAPELVVSAQAAARGSGAIAVGNVIGSNLCNLALILGLSALIRPIASSRAVLTRDLPVLIGASVLTVALLADRVLGRIDGAIFIIILLGYTWFTVRQARVSPDDAPPTGEPAPRRRPLPLAIGLTLGGLALLLVGADQFVDGAVTIAQQWGMSEVVIGLTVVAVGTSLPELALSVVAAARGHGDVALGNVVGSSTFNLLGILGFSALVRPTLLPDLDWMDLGVMLGVTVAIFPLLRSGGRLARWEGAGLILAYAIYTAVLINRA